ncbi:hypothetical protein Ade02nite_49290 [Paractinoplanes deccanensis]|uniref:Insertion element IS402-like domain-containing protein n=1 Tax=Paractinoplanes deccanensis TaxID=113561 RepID=A0ABQ3Y8F5_9ACTN|nr:hypothetical protein Ade02nite_49290 [Actinoplanes deccanensis]
MIRSAERLEPLLPSMAFQRDHRQAINGIPWRIDNGAKWAQISQRYGPAKTCYDRFSRWEQVGTWTLTEQRLRTDVDAAGDRTGMGRSTPAWCGRISMPRVLATRAEPAESRAAQGLGRS